MQPETSELHLGDRVEISGHSVIVTSIDDHELRQPHGPCEVGHESINLSGTIWECTSANTWTALTSSSDSGQHATVFSPETGTNILMLSILLLVVFVLGMRTGRILERSLERARAKAERQAQNGENLSE